MTQDKYSICTVDWNPEQTKVWLHNIEKYCNNYELRMCCDDRPIKGSWDSPKLNCLEDKFNTDKVIYMDTDTIVTRDLYEMFEVQGERTLGASLCLGSVKRLNLICGGRDNNNALAKHFGIGGSAFHVPSGLLVFNGIDTQDFYDKWMSAYRDIEKNFTNISGKADVNWCSEVPLSFIVSKMYLPNMDDLWAIPTKYHYYLLNGDTKARAMVPAPLILHYHSIMKRVSSAGFGKYLEVPNDCE